MSRLRLAGAAAIFSLILLVSGSSNAGGSSSQAATARGADTMTHATGTFEVKVVPLTFEGAAADSNLGRMSLDKQFHGDLEATSKGEMLTAGTNVKGSAAYVAVERVTGTLNGRNGGFSLQHSGTMTQGTPKLTVTVVPDSGTGQLTGLTGTMTIKIENGKHFYDFAYAIGEAH